MSETEKRSRFGMLPALVERARGSPYAERMRTALSEFGQRLDTWTNPATGFGTSRDKSTYGYVLPDRRLTDQELSALYHSDDMAARMVDVIPQEMLREGFTLETGDPDLDTIVADKIESLELRPKVADAIRWARCFGGAALLIGADDGRDALKELVPERARDIGYVYVIDRRLLWPVTYYSEPGHPKLGEPKTFLVTTMGGYTSATTEVHESRLLLFHGASTGKREKLQFFGWEMSVLQRAFNVLRQFNTGWTSVETMLVDGNQAVFEMGGLSEILRAGGEDALQQRIRAMDMFRSVVRAIVIDSDAKEKFTRQSVSFEQIPNTLEKFMLRLAASVEIPVTILMGQSPAGMNATGESDFRWFYDRVRAKQTTELGPKIRRLVDIWLRTKTGREATKGKKPETLTVKFPPLWTETPLVEAQRKLAIAQTDALYMTNESVTPEEVALSRFRPEGFQDDLQLSPEAVKMREDMVAAKAKEPTADETTEDTTLETTGEDKPIEDVQKLVLAPTDLAAIIKVNEGRESVGQPHLAGPDGDMTITAYKAKYAEVLATAAGADMGQAPGDPPKPMGGFGGGGFGGGKPPFPPKKSDDEDKPKPDVEDESEADGAKAASMAALSAINEERTDAAPRTFELHRDIDESGVSGTGVVAEGCVFSDGKVAIRWKTKTAATTIFDSIEDAIKVHGHEGKTRVVYGDE